MCTLIVAAGVYEDAPLLIAGNRDERLDRPAGLPVVRDAGSVPVLAPVDLRAGGTWIGLSGAGVCAAVTNRFGGPPDSSRRSRGELVFEALVAPDAARAAERVAALGPTAYNTFHLVVADRSGVHIVWCDGQRMHRLAPESPAVVVVSERSFGAAASGREEWLEGEVATLAERATAPPSAALQRLLATHRDPTFDGMCIHWGEHVYGTRSSHILTLGREREDVRFEYVPGPPCSTTRLDFSGEAARIQSQLP